MIIEAIATGDTVDEAVNAACKKLGLERDKVEIEVLELPSKKFFGFKHVPAKVRVYTEVEDKKPEVKETVSAPKASPAPKAPSAPKTEEAPCEAKKENKPKKTFENKPKKPAPAVKEENKAEEAPKEASHEDMDDRGEEIPMTDRGNAAFNYVKKVVSLMGIDNVEITAKQFEKAVVIKIDGEGAGAVIGKRGETLDALQYLSGLCTNRTEGDYCRVILDAGNYRQKRKQTLQNLARRLANNAVKSGRAITLEPMNPYERRIIHATVSEIKGATSTSLGEEPNRYVVISAEGASISPRRERPARGGRKPYGRDNRRNDRGDRRPRRERPEPYKETSVRETAPTEATDQPLYGKIEL